MSPQTPTGSFLACLCFLLGGCSFHGAQEGSRAPDVEMPLSFVELAGPSEAIPADGERVWWDEFEDPVLDQLIEQGLASNFDLMAFAARIEQASALARQAGSRLYPSLDADGRYEIEEDGRTSPGASEDREESLNLGLLLSWELDFFGRLSSVREARVFQREATVDDWKDARLLFSSAVADRYFDIKEQRRQLEVLQEQTEVNESLLKLTTLRYGQGQASIVDVLQQREQLDETKARVPEVEARLGQLQYSLDALLGLAPGQGLRIANSKLGYLPALPELGLPANLLERRADLRAARNRLLALDAFVGEAVAEQLPRIRLGAGLDWQGDPRLGDAVSSVFASAVAPLFAAGERRAEIAIRRAEVEEAVANYSDSFVNALREVESNLLLERKLRERYELVDEQLVTAQRLLSEARNRFSQGLTDYLPVFTSLIIVQNLEREIVTVRRDMLRARVSLHRALGGRIGSSSSEGGKA